MKRVIIFIIIVVFFITGLLFFSRLNRESLTSYLSPKNKIKANILLVEGWLPNYAIDSAKKEMQNNSYDLIILTGIKYYGIDYCTIGMNGYFIFYPGARLKNSLSESDHLIELDAHSEMDGKYRTHINFYINDSLMTDFDVKMKKQKYPVKWHGSLASIDSVMIQFTNDMIDDFGDRNLYIKELIIDNKIRIPYRHNSVYDVGLPDGKDRILSNYDSSPEILKRKLVESGIDSSRIRVITAEKTGINRTLASVNAVKKWAKSSGDKINGINVISLGAHSRRTWLTYKRILGNSYDIGIIPIKELEPSKHKNNGELSLVKETLDLFYYWIILIPFSIF